MENDVKVTKPYNHGWLEKKLNVNEIDHLWQCVKSSNISNKHKLVGQITESKSLVDTDNWFFNNTILPLCEIYRQEFNNIGDWVPINNRHPYFLQSWWVNFQNQNEFVPVHDHKGVYSFIIWLKIPTKHQEQNQNSQARSPKISAFQMFYLDILGSICQMTYEMNPEMENTMLFFPSSLKHCGYPFFNCDGEKISIAGNISINTSVIG